MSGSTSLDRSRHGDLKSSWGADCSVPSGAQAETHTTGVFEVAKNASDAFSVGGVAKVATSSNIIAAGRDSRHRMGD